MSETRSYSLTKYGFSHVELRKFSGPIDPGAVTGSPTNSWDVIREDVGIQLFGKKYSTVPILNEAKTFDVLCMYKKVGATPKGCFKGCFETPTYQIIGFLRDFLLLSKCNRKRLLEIAPKDASTKIGPVYQFTESQTSDGLLKEVILRVFSVYRQRSFMDHILAEEIFLDMSLSALNGLKTIYILCDVFLCRRFYLYTRIGRREIIDNQADERFPLGFRSAKFKLDSAGSLRFKKHCGPHRHLEDACWIPYGVTNEKIKNEPLLPLIPDSSSSTHRKMGKILAGSRDHSAIFRKLSLKTVSHSRFQIDDPDTDIIHDHSQHSSANSLNKKGKNNFKKPIGVI